jgi:transcriptional regulator with XRE-family HTH domain
MTTTLKKAKRPTKSQTVPARGRVQLSAGEMIRVTRELQEMTQADLAAASGIAQGTISSLEVGRVSLGVERAERLARALKVHPAVLLWPNWDETEARRVG